jgi:hypothetical protein
MKMNALDLELFEYAQALAARRMFCLQPQFGAIKQQMKTVPKYNSRLPIPSMCGRKVIYAMSAPLNASIGIYRPPYHKGPLNITKILLNITDEEPKLVNNASKTRKPIARITFRQRSSSSSSSSRQHHSLRDGGKKTFRI